MLPMNSPVAASSSLNVAGQRAEASDVGPARLRRYRISRLRFDARVAGRVVEAQDSKAGR
jgi:hypothetical protein